MIPKTFFPIMIYFSVTGIEFFDFGFGFYRFQPILKSGIKYRFQALVEIIIIKNV